MMSQLGSAMDVSTAREMILRDTELEVSFDGFCNIVKAAGERTCRHTCASSPQARSSLNAIVLKKYKSHNQ
jgi:hypothetical protein